MKRARPIALSAVLLALALALGCGVDGGRAGSSPARERSLVPAAAVSSEEPTWGGLRVHHVVREEHGPPATDLVVILLHGWGARGDDLVGMARSLSVPSGTRFLVPEAPLDRPGGGRAWWHLDANRLRNAPPGGRDLSRDHPEGLEEARAAITAVVADARRIYDVSADRIVIGGFSQGAMLATDVALHADDALGGVFVLSGTPLAMDEWRPRMGDRPRVPFFVSHGRADPILPYAGAERLGEELRSAGHPVVFVAFEGRHAIPPPVRASLGDFLTRLARRPSP